MKNVVCIAACLCSLFSHAETYELTILSPTNESCAYGLNSYGFAVGYQMLGGYAVPCIWAPEGSPQILPRLPIMYVGCVASAYAINDSFIIVGTSDYWNASDVFHLGNRTAGYWYFDRTQPNFVSKSMNVPGFVAARGVNSQGSVAGWNYSAGGGGVYEYFINDTTTDHTENGRAQSRCFGINDASNACGDYVEWVSGGTASPCFFQLQADGFHSYTVNTALVGSCGMSINDQNEIVGYDASQGFYWNPLLAKTVTFGNGTQCYGINDQGVIVGTTNGHACMWTSTTNGYAVRDLNDLISEGDIVLERAFGINTNNQIVGQLLNKVTGIRSGFLFSHLREVKVTLSKTANGAMLRWNARSGHGYTIKHSRDLVKWDKEPGIYMAVDPWAYVSVPTDEPMMFFQVFDHTP